MDVFNNPYIRSHPYIGGAVLGVVQVLKDQLNSYVPFYGQAMRIFVGCALARSGYENLVRGDGLGARAKGLLQIGFGTALATGYAGSLVGGVMDAAEAIIVEPVATALEPVFGPFIKELNARVMEYVHPPLPVNCHSPPGMCLSDKARLLCELAGKSWRGIGGRL